MICRQNRARLNRLFGQDIGGTDDHADFGPTRGQFGPKGRNHRARHVVMNATGKQDFTVDIARRTIVIQNGVDRLLPQNGGCPRAHMAATFTALENEPARAAFQEQADQPRRRDVQIGRNALFFQRKRLIRTPARDQGEIRPVFQNNFGLFGAQVVIDKPKDTNTPRRIAHLGLGVRQQGRRRILAHQGQRQERQRAAIGHGLSEICSVRDAGHRPLNDRETGAVRRGQRAVLGQRFGLLRQLDQFTRLARNRVQRRANTAIGFRKTVGECRVLPDQPDAGLGRGRINGGVQFPQEGRRIGSGNIMGLQRLRGLVISAPEHAGRNAHIMAQQVGFGPVHARNRAGNRGRRGGLGHQGQLPIQNNTLCPRNA